MYCPFCDKGPAEAFLSSPNFLAIYNIAPVLPGHSMVVPKRHVESLLELTNKEAAELMLLGRDVAKLLTKALNTEAFDWIIQEKEAAGQTVAHLHLHVIPRIIGDLPNPGDWFLEVKKSNQYIDSPNRQKLKPEEMNKIVHNLRELAKQVF